MAESVPHMVFARQGQSYQMLLLQAHDDEDAVEQTLYGMSARDIAHTVELRVIRVDEMREHKANRG